MKIIGDKIVEMAKREKQEAWHVRARGLTNLCSCAQTSRVEEVLVD